MEAIIRIKQHIRNKKLTVSATIARRVRRSLEMFLTTRK
jgi:hypothetical protein